MSWDDGKHAKVKRVQLTFDDVIRSIQVEYDGTNLQRTRGPIGSNTDGFTLSPDEYLTDLTGYEKNTVSGNVITALTFKTNKKTYGPYGTKTRNYFSATPPTNQQIAGFHGTSSTALNSIDVHFAPIPPPGSTGGSSGGTTTPSGGSSGGTTVPPSGGSSGGTTAPPGGSSGGGTTAPPSGGSSGGGTTAPPGGSSSGGATPPGGSSGGGATTDSNPQKVEAQGGKGGNQWDDGSEHDGVTRIHVAAGGLGIEFIKFDYIKNGQPKEGPSHGVKGGRVIVETIEINHPKEYLISVEGWYSDDIIEGIQFKTNTGTIQYFGYQEGTHFSLEVKDKKIIGFHGFSSSHLNSIGAYFAPIATAITPLKPAKKLNAIGGNGGASWDDGSFDGVKKIYVGQGNDGVAFLMFEYNKGSQVIVGDGRGKKTALGTETFELDYPSEYITSVEGYYDKVYGVEAEVMTSLTFKTNKRTSQPFGMTAGEHFELKDEGNKVVGFHGKAGDYVHQIGVYVAPRAGLGGKLAKLQLAALFYSYIFSATFVRKVIVV